MSNKPRAKKNAAHQKKQPEIVAFRIVTADATPIEVGRIMMFKDVVPKEEFGLRYGIVQGTGEVVFGVQLKNQDEIDKHAENQAKADTEATEEPA